MTIQSDELQLPPLRILLIETIAYADDLVTIVDPENRLERWSIRFRRRYQDLLAALEDETISPEINEFLLQGKALTNLRPTPLNDEIRNEDEPDSNFSPRNASNSPSLPLLTPSPTAENEAPRNSTSPQNLTAAAEKNPSHNSLSTSTRSPQTPRRAASPIHTIASINGNDSSGESSDEDVPRNTVTMSRKDSQYAELIQTSSSKCCEVTDGELTPQLIHDFIRKQKNWFVAKDIKAADQAKRSFVAFSNNRKLDKYIDNNSARLAALEFDPFDWTKKVLTELMSKKLRRGSSFATHSQDVVYLNRLLEGTAEHQTDIQMRSHVTASLPSELHEHAFSIVAATYDEWSSELVKLIKKDYDLGKRLALSNPNLTATIQNATTSTLQPPFQYVNQNQQMNQNSFSSSFPSTRPSTNQNGPPMPNQNAFSYPQQRNADFQQGSNSFANRPTDNGYQGRYGQPAPFNQTFSNNYRSGPRGPLQQVDKRAPNYDWPPYLQASEREVLMELRGCLGCRRTDVPPGHRANNCNTSEHLCPHGTDYQMVTRESAMRQMQKRAREANPNPNFISPTAPAPKRPKPVVSVVPGYPASIRASLEQGQPLQLSRPLFMDPAQRRASSEGPGRRRGLYARRSESDNESQGQPNVSMPVTVLYDEFGGRESDEDDERPSEDEDELPARRPEVKGARRG
ncbi:hypothetical protein C8J56DRAFT_1041139 [Mycena floridula]|nr:hypothetical protein C8J56DRAFT_1041139 [Mycena floridula]